MYLTFVDLQMRKPIKAIKRRHLERMSGGLAVVAVSPRDEWAIVLISILNYILRTTLIAGLRDEVADQEETRDTNNNW